MAWSEFGNNPITQDMVDKRSEETLDSYIDELEFRYEDNYDKIEEFIDSEYPSPEEAPNLTPAALAQIAGRELKSNVSKIREFYTEFNGTDNMADQDLRRTLEFIAMKSLRNGSG
jgi:hypothetical protein